MLNQKMRNMDAFGLKKLAQHNTSMREAGVSLLLASGMLAVFLAIPHPAPQPEAASAPVVAAATTTVPDAFAHVQINAKAAIVYDLATGKVLYAKNAHAQLPLASLTKLLTVYAAVSTLSPNASITIPQDVANLDAPHAFTPGQVFTLKNLARLTLTASLNDGAQAIAEATAAAQDKALPNTLAAAASGLDLAQTYALNGSGLDINTVISGGYGSAYDLARLAGALAKKASYITEATTQEVTEEPDADGTVFSVKNTDPMVGTFPHLLLSKTGYTDLAGGNLALVVDVGMGHPVAVVVLGSTVKDRFTDGSALVAATLAHFAGVASL